MLRNGPSKRHQPRRFATHERTLPQTLFTQTRRTQTVQGIHELIIKEIHLVSNLGHGCIAQGLSKIIQEYRRSHMPDLIRIVVALAGLVSITILVSRSIYAPQGQDWSMYGRRFDHDDYRSPIL